MHVKRPTGSWWNRYSFKALVLTTAALFGAFSAIRDYFGVLFAAPDAIVSYTDNGKLDVVEEGKLAVSLTAQSEAQFAPMSISFESSSIRPRAQGQVFNLTPEPASIPALGPGQSQSIRVVGMAPKHSKTQEAPELYDLGFAATAKAGMFRSKRILSAVKRELWVWPAQIAKPHPDVFQILANKTCELNGAFYIPQAYPQGLTAEIVLVTKLGEISKISVNAPGVPDIKLIPAVDEKGTVWVFQFPTPSLDKFEKYSYKVFVESPRPVTTQDCQGWTERLRISLE